MAARESCLTPPNIQDSYQFDCGQKSDLGDSRKGTRGAHKE
jgi:hypothetical protein